METSGCFLCHRPAILTCPSSDLKFCGPEHQELCLMLLLLSFCLFVFWPQVLQIRTSDIVYVDLFAMHVWNFRVCSLCGPLTRSELSLSKCQIVTLGGEDPLRLILKGKGLRLTWYLSNLFVVQSGRKCIDIIITAIIILDILVIITTNIKAKGMRLK